MNIMMALTDETGDDGQTSAEDEMAVAVMTVEGSALCIEYRGVIVTWSDTSPSERAGGVDVEATDMESADVSTFFVFTHGAHHRLPLAPGAGPSPLRATRPCCIAHGAVWCIKHAVHPLTIGDEEISCRYISNARTCCYGGGGGGS